MGRPWNLQTTCECLQGRRLDSIAHVQRRQSEDSLPTSPTRRQGDEERQSKGSKRNLQNFHYCVQNSNDLRSKGQQRSSQVCQSQWSQVADSILNFGISSEGYARSVVPTQRLLDVTIA